MSAPLKNPEEFYWRTDFKTGSNIYALLSNDSRQPSVNDPLIGTMINSTVAEDVVVSHNGLLKMYGRKYSQRIAQAEG